MPLKVYSFSVATGSKWFTVMQHSSGFVELDMVPVLCVTFLRLHWRELSWDYWLKTWAALSYSLAKGISGTLINLKHSLELCLDHMVITVATENPTLFMRFVLKASPNQQTLWVHLVSAVDLLSLWLLVSMEEERQPPSVCMEYYGFLGAHDMCFCEFYCSRLNKWWNSMLLCTLESLFVNAFWQHICWGIQTAVLYREISTQVQKRECQGAPSCPFFSLEMEFFFSTLMFGFPLAVYYSAKCCSVTTFICI
jgi:hypothetical protein